MGRLKGVVVFVAVFLYFNGLMLTDYGASLRVSGGHGESLVFASISPRVLYHAGLLSQMVGFFLLYSVSVSYLIRAPHEKQLQHIERA